MRKKETGFTLIELMIVIAIIAVLVAVAVPNLLGSRVAANEAKAIATLRSIMTAQAQFQALVAVDANGNGVGEYGYFAELSGSPITGLLSLRDRRAAAAPLSTPVLGATFQNVNSNGHVIANGYLFRIFLANHIGLGWEEAPNGGPGLNGGSADPYQSELFWSAYAWPLRPGVTGSRAFFVDHRGTILQTQMNAQVYNEAIFPFWPSAFLPGPFYMNDTLCRAGAAGHDGNAWKEL